jgi:chromate transport protein ChrA
MKNGKQRYIDQIRINTAYPNYRRFVGIVAILGYVLAGLLVLITLLAFIEAVSVGEYREGFTFLVGSVIAAIIIIFMSRLLKEAALIFSDIADSITDTNSKISFGQ